MNTNFRETFPAEVLEKFDDIGVHSVKAKLEFGSYAGKNKKWARRYVAHCRRDREEAAANRGESGAEEALSIARSANFIASDAVRIARQERTLTIIAAIAAIIAALATAYIAYSTV